MTNVIGTSPYRKDAMEKVAGTAKYAADFTEPGLLHAKLLVSPHAHARIKSIDMSEALKHNGVRAILTGKDVPVRTGSHLEDRPLLAIDKVRYCGEPVAIVVADTEHEAKAATYLIKVDYDVMPPVNGLKQALQPETALVHEGMAQYKEVKPVYPVINTNFANWTKVRKGDIQEGWRLSEVTVEADFSFPQSDHAAMETRCSYAEISPSGEVSILSASQAPFNIKKLINRLFLVPMHNIKVQVPLVGGGFGGKAAVQLELLAYAASKAAGGRKVKLVNSREEDMGTSPVHIGLDASVKLGCTKTGKLTALQVTFLFDGGAYSDEAVDISKIAALDCTGPYKIDHVWCDSKCLYTNHAYATSFRGYAHSELTFPIERVMDMLAMKLQMDPIEFRMKNAIKPGDTTPSQTELTASNVGDLFQCLQRLKEIAQWEQRSGMEEIRDRVRAMGVACLWKTPISPTNASSGAVITFNQDGSINLQCGVVEIGQGTKTVLAQILAEKLNMSIDKVHVVMEVRTESNPEHWKTVASSSVYMAGNAVMRAAEDAIQQLRTIASIPLHCSPEDVEIGNDKAYIKANPKQWILIKDIAHGYRYRNGNTVGNQVIGRGSFVMKHLTHINPETGEGTPGPGWTIGAQIVEVEYDKKTCAYTITKAYSVIDAGKVLNPMAAKGQVMGAMSMGLSFASREEFRHDCNGGLMNNQFRSYKVLRYGENPEYIVDFVETPKADAPYGSRGLGEQGLIGMPAALANALSTAAGIPLNRLPLTPETIWKTKEGLIH